MLEITNSRYFKWTLVDAVLILAVWWCTFRFYPVYSFILIFIDFGMLLLYIAMLLRSIVFLIGKRKEYDYPFLPLLIYVLIALTIYELPSIARNKSYYRSTFNLRDNKSTGCKINLYLESYYVYGQGAFGSDVLSDYLTDSTNFRLYIGIDEEDGAVIVQCKGDSIIVEKMVRNIVVSYTYKGDSVEAKLKPGKKFDPFKLEGKKVYNLKDLKRQRVFD